MVAPPPLMLVAAVVAGVVLDAVWPIHVPAAAVQVFGIVFLVLSASLASWSFRAFAQMRTNVLPHKPTTAVVKHGPYRYTRNPMYVSLVMLQTSIAVLLGNVWILFMIVPLVLALHYGVVMPEERYLEQKFGEEYLSYKRSVRRWL